jgi:hypothetical protein
MNKQNAQRMTGKARRNKAIRGDGDIISKRLTLPAGQIASTAGGIIALATAATAAFVQASPASEWASFAARYQQFRVRSVTLIMEPRFPASGTPITVVGSHGALFVADFIGASVPGTAAQLLSDEAAVVTNTSKKVVFTVDWTRNPNARLWNPTGAALPVANSYGIAVAGSAGSTLAVSTAYFDTILMWDVEFRGSQ